MHIVVCIKQIIDPEVPFHLFRIDPVTKTQVRGSHPLVISSYDEVAVEVAIQAKEKFGGQVTVVTIGSKEALQALHQALAMGADNAVLICDPTIERADSFGKAHILAAALRKIGNFDLVLCGRQAGDVEMGLVGPFLAEELGLPCVTLVANVTAVEGRKIYLKRPIEEGYEIIQAPLPCLATITNDESNIPRYASVKKLRAAMRSPIPTWTAIDLELEPAIIGEARIQIEEMWVPKREIRCEFIGGESPEEKARNLVLRLKELGLL